MPIFDKAIRERQMSRSIASKYRPGTLRLVAFEATRYRQDQLRSRSLYAITKLQVRAELYIAGDTAKASFHLLRKQAAEIERELGHSLEREELPTGQDSRITVYLNEFDPTDSTDWSRQHARLATKLNIPHRIFASRRKARIRVNGDQSQSPLGVRLHRSRQIRLIPNGEYRSTYRVLFRPC